jgi:putative ABC transport system substrate-binding protein
MRRREFLTVIGGAAAAWPLAAHAQQRERVRRIGVLMSRLADDPESQRRIGAFLQGLQELGWMIGRNIQIDYRWAATGLDRSRALTAELIALGPEVVLTDNGNLVVELQNVSRTIPIVFAGIIDAVGAGRVESLAHPGGNATGFASVEFSMSVKWLELIKQIAPKVTRVAVLRGTGSGQFGQFGALQGAAPLFGLELRPLGLRSADEIEQSIADFARSPNGGLIAMASSGANNNRDLIIKLVAQHRLPAIFSNRAFVAGGGLASYGPNGDEQFRGAAGYVDRILRGAKPGDLPVQLPTKYELAINLKTAKALGLAVPPTLLVAADEVIE